MLPPLLRRELGAARRGGSEGIPVAAPSPPQRGSGGKRSAVWAALVFPAESNRASHKRFRAPFPNPERRGRRSGVMGGRSSDVALPALGRGEVIRPAGEIPHLGEAILHIGLVHIGREHQAAEADRADPVKKFLKHSNNLLFNCRGKRFQPPRI